MPWDERGTRKNKMASQHFGYAGWSAYVSAIATIVTFISAILFFSLGQPFGTINDIASVFQVVFMLPLALVLYRLFSSHNQNLSFLATALGIGGILVAGAIQSLLILGTITFQQSAEAFPSGTAIGGWLILSSYLGLSSQLLPRGLGWAGLLGGAGYIMTVVGFLVGGYQNPVFYAGGLLTVMSYSTWAFWLGYVFLLRKPEVNQVSGI
jgi:hypothetical protein